MKDANNVILKIIIIVLKKIDQNVYLSLFKIFLNILELRIIMIHVLIYVQKNINHIV